MMHRSTRILTLAAGTALASLTLAGCATQAAPRADLSAGQAAVALKKGKIGSAIAHAEAAVLAEPRNAAYRATLAAAYMEAGRFLSARTSFDDALELGDESPRTVLGFALAAIATGDRGAALQVLGEWQSEIPAADLGLALALAGDTPRAIHVLSNAVRGGDNTPKVRQNLAYALALNGNWAGARIMAAEDVPADRLDARMAQWAAMAQAEQSASRIATLLGTRIAPDAGQPAQLALANHPTIEKLAQEAISTSPSPSLASAPSGGELPALASAEAAAPAPEPALAATLPDRAFEAAFADAASTASPTSVAVSPAGMVAQPVAKATARSLVQRAAGSTPAAGSGKHLVQLGSFSSEAGARRAWSIYAKRFPQLADYDMVVTKAVVRGKTYFRVSAGGLSRAAAASTCASVRSKGQGCFAWAEGRPMPGAVDRAVRFAGR